MAQQIELTKEEQQWIDEHPTIRAAGGTDYVPIQFMRNGKANGLSIDYINLIAGKVGLKVEYVNGFTWEQHIEKIYNKELDIISSISSTLGRDEFLYFSDPYIHLPYVYYGRVGSDPINDIEDLEGKRIGAIDGWNTTETYKKDYKHLILVEQSSSEEALQSLSDGSIDVFIVPEVIGNYIIRQNFITGLEIIGERFIPEIKEGDYLQIGARKDWPILNDIIKKGMAAVTTEDYMAILEKWIPNSSVINNIGLTTEEINWLSSNKTIRIVADPTSSPIEFIDLNGQISGYAGDYLALISRILNVNFEWIGNRTLTEGISIIKEGGADLMAAVTESPERIDYLNFSDSYLATSSVIFANKENTSFINLQSLSGHTLAQVEGFSVTEHLRSDYPELNIVTVDSMMKALQMVNDGEVDAYVGTILSSSAIISSNGMLQIGVVGDTPYQALIRIATRKELPLLSSAIDKALNSITELERTEISNKWAAIQVEEIQNYDLLWKFGGSASIIVLIIFFWITKLRNEILLRKNAEGKVESALVEAEEANAAKSIFLANMSHELRTPLNAIIGFSEAMMMGVGGKIATPKHTEYIKYIKKSGDHLIELINDVLDLSKIEAEKWDLSEKEFLLVDTIKGVINMLAPQAAYNKIELVLEGEKTVTLFGDEHAFKRIIINLLSNSLKFTPENGKVRCVITELKNGCIKVEIIDNGCGIAKDNLEQVLNPFEQVQEKYVSNSEGTGLGLPIVKKLIEMHGGEFILKSDAGVGTCATFIIPADRAKFKR
ncbi:MAG: transporter substrate-binding domain-containing protein [Kordiimonadaceae bacterium]|nr:transporter substrate-binding domain-containing protein [Kordiimonadaceae bacterium]MBT6032988.1 transporter substrate-binding domain-containing protein [Kordiimonadaceae bacterium]